MAGEPMRVGSAALPDAPQGEDHPLVARLRAAGAVVIGLTNLPELAIYPFTDSAFGITRNPWDRRRTAGGSSGGSAAAVAAALVPVAYGTDGLGSVRIPAAACGLSGIKPGSGTVPGFPAAGNWDGLSENGVLAGTVADAAVTLGVMAGTGFDLAEPSRLRIAVSVRPPGPASSCTARAPRRSASARGSSPRWTMTFSRTTRATPGGSSLSCSRPGSPARPRTPGRTRARWNPAPGGTSWRAGRCSGCARPAGKDGTGCARRCFRSSTAMTSWSCHAGLAVPAARR